MKICYVCPDHGIRLDGLNGAAAHFHGFIGALKDLGHELTAVSARKLETGLSIDVPVIEIDQPKLIEGFSRKQNPELYQALRFVLSNVAVENTLLKIIENDKPDLIYERYSPFSAAAGTLAAKHNIPHILEVNAPLAEQGTKYRNQAMPELAEYFEKTAFANTTLVVSLTNELKDWLIEQGVPPEKIIVRPCGIDPERFNPFGDSYKEMFSGKIVIGFVGSIKPWHDIELLAKSFRLLAKNPKYHLLVVGDGPMMPVLNSLSEDLPGCVTLTGAISQDEVPKYIRAMDITVAPYPELDLFYFSPLKVYEYMAMGKAIVATDIGQLGSVIRHGENGLLTPAGDADLFVKAIETIGEDPSYCSRIGAQAAEEARLYHTWKCRAEYFIEEIDKKFKKKFLTH